ncbi:hypothetical protein Tco_0351652 [Tanacetum coccineum]
MKRASKGYTGVDTPLFQTMLVQGQILHGEGSTIPTHVANKAASTGVDVRHRGAATTVSSLDAGQGSGNIDKTPTMPHDSPLLRVHTLRSDEGRMQHNELMDLVTKLLVLLEEEDSDIEILAQKDPSKQGRKIAQIDDDEGITLFTTAEDVSTANVPVNTVGAEISTASPKVKTAGVSVNDVAAEGLVYIRRSAAKRKDKDKAIMEESEPTQTKTKIQQEQERLGFEEAQRLQEQFDEEERQRIASIHEEASTFKPEEWDNTQAQIEADEELAHSSKRSVKEELGEESSKRQKIGEGSEPAEESKDKESDELSQEQLQQFMLIVSEERMNVEALQIKYPIIDCEVYTKDSRMYWKIIRVEPTEDKERELCVELKRLFERVDNDELWKS